MKIPIVMLLIVNLFSTISCQTQGAKTENKDIMTDNNMGTKTSIESNGIAPSSPVSAQASGNPQKINLNEIKKFTEKGRVQDKDYNPNQEVIEKLIAQGIVSIPL